MSGPPAAAGRGWVGLCRQPACSWWQASETAGCVFLRHLASRVGIGCGRGMNAERSPAWSCITSGWTLPQAVQLPSAGLVSARTGLGQVAWPAAVAACVWKAFLRSQLSDHSPITTLESELFPPTSCFGALQALPCRLGTASLGGCHGFSLWDEEVRSSAAFRESILSDLNASFSPALCGSEEEALLCGWNPDVDPGPPLGNDVAVVRVLGFLLCNMAHP